MDCLRPLLFKLQSAVLPDLVGYINIFIICDTISEYRQYQSTEQVANYCFVKLLFQFYTCVWSGWVKCISYRVPDFNFLNFFIYVNVINLCNKGLLSTYTIVLVRQQCAGVM